MDLGREGDCMSLGSQSGYRIIFFLAFNGALILRRGCPDGTAMVSDSKADALGTPTHKQSNLKPLYSSRIEHEITCAPELQTLSCRPLGRGFRPLPNSSQHCRTC